MLRVTGDLETEGTAALRSAIAKHSQDYTAKMVVELTDVTYCPSLAIAMLVTATKLFKASGTSFEMAAATGSVADRVLRICGLGHRAY